ncbi:MAG: hypothetical protein ETSY2_45725 [Candidatus Entotheonella gemina]|uniref:Uncharacterized protein n=1 Tax=Candidatus Entotheonella gemina TaxID=1429439 RepID=W4LFQ5_9BACT|nr:MAG: hypothetical protein ETSY2_45725 [Candidatus Entotheonella gemina]
MGHARRKGRDQHDKRDVTAAGNGGGVGDNGNSDIGKEVIAWRKEINPYYDPSVLNDAVQHLE